MVTYTEDNFQRCLADATARIRDVMPDDLTDMERMEITVAFTKEFRGAWNHGINATLAEQLER